MFLFHNLEPLRKYRPFLHQLIWYQLYSIRFSITPILSETLAPPKIATKGLSGFSKALPMTVISFSTKKPTADGK